MKTSLQQASGMKWSAMARHLKKFTGRTALAGGLLVAGWLNPGDIKAQTIVNNYDFAASTGTYTPLGASATQLPLVKADTYISPVIPIGFTFNFDGVDYTNFLVSSNGFISFNASSSSETSNNLTSATSRPLIAPLWDDLDGNATGGVSNASYEVTGTTGSRVLTFEWRNWEWNYGSSTPVLSFQVKLYEGTNKIEFVYQQETGAVASGSASIGIAGVGANNFMSLNNTTATPTASTSTETTTISTKPATGQIYAFNRVIPSALDVMASGLVSPVSTGCFGTNQTVQVSIKNNGTAPLNFATTPVTVNASGVIGTTTTTFAPVIVNTGTLAPGASQNVTVSTTYNMSTAGTYTFNATATVAGDGRTLNDAMAPANVIISSRQVAAAVALPQSVDFTGFTGSNLTAVFPNWSEASGVPATGTSSAWTSKTGLGTATNVTAKINLYSNSAKEWIMGPKITPTATTVLKFKTAVTDYESTAADATGMTGTDDKVQVMVSTDCGATFTPIMTFDATSNLTNVLTQQNISLAAYAGQNIMVGFFATEGTVNDAPDYDFHIDDIFIGTPPTADLGVTALINPVSPACYGASESVVVTIQNFGTSTIDFSTTNATVSVRTHGAVGNTISIPVTTGTLAAGATQNVTVGNLNMTTVGTYNLRAYTTLAGDNNAANDTTRASRIVAPIVTLPQTVDFTGFTGSNLTAVFPNWSEASGVPATGTSSAWTSKTGLGTATNVTAKINLYSNSAKEWIMGPKITPTATTVLKFKTAVTDYESTAADATGMTGTDDKVQVMVSTDCGATFTPIMTFDATSNLTNVLTQQNISLAAYAGQNIKIAFFATEGTVNDAPDYDFHIDDINIYNVPPVDMEVISVTLPTNSCGMTASETICITIQNSGSTSASNFPVTYSVNGGTPITETVTATIAPNATTQYCFTTKANFLVAGTYSVTASVNITGDANAANNSVTATTISKQTVSTFPYTEGFENGAGGWVASGTNSTWALGTPNKTVINSAAGGTKAWVTNLTGTYVNDENSTVTGPCFNFANVANPTISMKIWWDTEFSWDGAVLQSSINGGQTWQNVGAMSDPNNWYNDNSIGANPGGQQIGWTGTGTTGSGGWVTASHALTGLGGQSGVQLRIAFAADGSTVKDGFAFDDITISNVVAVPTITAGGPTTFCQGGSVVLTAASATTGATFTWALNGTAIAGATSNTYTANASGNYTVTATAGGSATSTPTTVTVNAPAATPTITAGGATTFCTGGSVTLTAASATTGATYQWFNNATAITGATAATYAATTAGSYTVVATTNNCSSAVSTATTVTVNAVAATPTVTAGGATTFCSGSSVVLTAASATSGATYTWFLNGTAITGATSATYTANAAGTYTAVATANGCPSQASAATTITVNATPATPTISQNGGLLTSSSATGNQWFLNGVAIPGATGSTYVTAANGNYTVVVTTNGCASATSAVKTVTNTGVSTALAGMSVDVYPNPATGSFNVKLNGYQKEASVVLYNLAGQEIMNDKVAADGNVKNIKLKGLAAGTYLLKVTSDNGVQVTRLVVE